MENFKIDIDADGVALVAFDAAGRSMNTLSDAVISELPELIASLNGDPAVRSVVIASGKKAGFCAGADLGDLAHQAGTRIEAPALSPLLRALETLGKPVAAALEGLALGGGLELALACHYRVAAPGVKLGLPEVTIGLLPGAGGTQRLPRLIGIAKALPLLLEGRPIDAGKARDLGFVDEVVPAGEVVEAAKRWARAATDATPRWDQKGFEVPGGTVYDPAGTQSFIMSNAMVRKKGYGNYPAQENILSCVFEGMQVPIDAGLRIEARYFVNTFATPQAKAMIRTLFLSRQALAKVGAGSVKRPSKVAVIGAGMMGAGIAYAQAAKGVETVLVDVSQEAAERGKGYAVGLVEGAVAKGRMKAETGVALLARIVATDNYDALADTDLVVEAVFENAALKSEVIRHVEHRVRPDVVFGSNTSTLPITDLAVASSRPENFVGIHFFSPVDRMDLVEIIRGAETSEATVANAVAYASAIGKTPIVVNDSRGFYTSRCFGTYIYEGLEMLVEGVPLALIENAGRMTGMPRGPLELTDDIAIDLTVKIAQETRAALGDAYNDRPYQPIIEKLVAMGRTGRKANAGFYDYPAGAAKRLWREITDMLPTPSSVDTDIVTLKRRLLHRQAVEAARCFDEGVVTDPRAADVGAVLGWGFAAWTGGPLSYIDGIGASIFVRECDALAALHGDRFSPPAGLRAMAASGGSYYGAPLAAVAA